MSDKLNALINQVSDSGLLPDTNTHKLRFDVRSASSNRLYRVSIRKSTNQPECGCPGFIRHRHCKHLDAIAPTLKSAVELLALEEGKQ